MPVGKLAPATIGRILAGGAAVCAAAGIPVAGGHSIDSVEPIYGLVALGLVHPDKVMTNKGARAGDALILTKALGVGVLSAAFKQERLSAEGYAALIASTTQLNTLGAELAGMAGVQRGDRRHRLRPAGPRAGDEPRRGPGGSRSTRTRRPLLPEAEALARAGVRTGASTRNWASYGADVRLPAALADWRRDLLTDPQTSGGLLIAVAAEHAEAVLELAKSRGFAASRIVGRVTDGPAGIVVRG